MTIEHKIVVGLDDIKAVIIECKQCHAKVSLSPDDLQIPARCPVERCASTWIKGQRAAITNDYEATTSAHINLVEAIAHIRAKKNGAAFRILLEFENQI
jgi:uncharacterized paraquat-inducible protein A